MTNPPLPEPERDIASAPETPAAVAETEQPADRGAGARTAGVLVVLALIALSALGVAVWQWHDSRAQFDALRQEVARKLAEADVRTKEGRLVAEQVREAAADAQIKIGVLENRLAESQSQQIALEALYQELSRNRDEWTYAEIEQSLLIANQQLQLAGNVKAALIALQNVDARLQRLDRPQLTVLRKAISRDMERLKALPHVDTVGISVRLDNLIAAIDKFPLAMDVRPPAPAEAGVPAEGPAWARLLREAWNEIKLLVRIQHMDKPDVALLSPAQTFFLRENVKLRLLGARLALLARDETSYKADLKAAREWLDRYYDTRNNHVIHAVSTLRNLHAGELSIEVPDISATLDALHKLRPARERGAR